MKVRIDAGGRQVEIECADANVTAKDVADVALATWHETSGAGGRGTEGPAFGLTASGATTQPRDSFAWRTGRGEQLPVRAEG